MILKQGDVFTTEAYYIGHGVNVDGVMGAGVAATVRDLFPATYDAYRRRCREGLKPGSIHAYRENDKMILNLATQDRPGPNAQYYWVFEALLRAAKGISTLPAKYGVHDKIIAIPQIGCGIGGLEWAGVEAIINAVETIVTDVQFEVWEYKP